MVEEDLMIIIALLQTSTDITQKLRLLLHFPKVKLWKNRRHHYHHFTKENISITLTTQQPGIIANSPVPEC